MDHRAMRLDLRKLAAKLLEILKPQTKAYDTTSEDPRSVQEQEARFAKRKQDSDDEEESKSRKVKRMLYGGGSRTVADKSQPNS